MIFLGCLKISWTDPPVCVCAECPPWGRMRGRGFGITARAALPVVKRLAIPSLKKAILPGLASAGAEAGFRKLFGGRGKKKR